MQLQRSKRPLSRSILQIGGLNITYLLLLTLGSNALMFVLPFFSMQVFDRVIPTGNLSTLAWLASLAVGAFGLHLIMDGTRASALCRIATGIEHQLLACAAVSGHARNGSRTGVFSDIDLVRTAICGTTTIALLDAPFCPAFFIALYFLHPLLGLIAVLSLIPQSVIGLLSYRSVSKLRSQSAEHNSRALSLLHQTQQSPDVSSAYTTGVSYARSILNHRQIASGLMLGSNERQAWFDAALRGSQALSQLCILVVAAVLVVNQAVNTGCIVAASMLFSRGLGPVNRLIAIGPGVRNFLLTLTYLARTKSAYDSLVSPLPLPDLDGEISFEGVSICGQAGQTIIDDLSLTLAKGTITVVVGAEGAGKSTLLKALVGARLLTSGQIRIGGTNIQDIPPEQLQDGIGYLSDEPRLLSASAAHVITRLRSPDSKAYIDAAILTGAHSQIQRFPSGYQTLVGPGGHPISAGERQRLLLARAFYERPKLIVLDEPMTGLDDDGMGCITAALLEMRKTGSSIVLACRDPRLMHLTDRLLLLENGKIVRDMNDQELASYKTVRLAAAQ